MTSVKPKTPADISAQSLWSHTAAVSAAAVAAILIGGLIPWPTLALDICWVAVLCIALGTSITFPAATSTTDLKGFVPMLTIPVLMRLVLVAATLHRLLGGRPVGTVITATGQTLTVVWPLGMALVYLAAAAFLTVAIYVACQKIAAAADRYRRRIYPLKRIGIQTDLKMGVIADDQARTLAEKVDQESRLFAELSGAALLMRFEAGLAIAAMLTAMLWPLAARNAASFEAAGIAAAVGLGVLSLIPAALSAIAAAYLAGKDSLTLRPAPPQTPPAGRTFTLVDKDTGKTEEVELLNPDFVSKSDNTLNAADMQIAEFEPPRILPLIEKLTLTSDSSTTYYRQLAEQTAVLTQAGRVVIFASEQVADLPVTVFVNTAIQLLQKGQKILLVDADKHRNALRQVFDIPPERLNSGICATGFEGLDVLSLWAEAAQVKAALAEAAENYSAILVYAPHKDAWPQLAETAGQPKPAAFVFGIDDANAADTLTDVAEGLHFCRQLLASIK